MAVPIFRRDFLSWWLASLSFIASPYAVTEPTGAQILVERTERVRQDEVRFWVNVKNRSDRSIFLTAIDYELLGVKDESGPRPYPIYLEQWRAKDGWTTVSCIDTPPPHIMELNPSEATTQELRLELPMSVVCKNRITRFEGKFRFRVEYFDSEKQARAYVKKLFSDRWREARVPVAVSEPFEIPPIPSLER